jgi:hypothetical protein
LVKLIWILDNIIKLVFPTSKYSIKMEKNKNIDPNRVYKNNKKLALIRLSLEPQIPNIKKIGIKILSKKKKKIIKSIDAKDRMINNSSISKYKQ